MKFRLFCLLIFSALFLPKAQAKAQKSQDAWKKLEKALSQEPNLSQKTKQALKSVFQELKSSPSSTETSKGWSKVLKNLTLYGDFRFRWESTFVPSQPDRHRPRLRFRPGAKYQVAPGWEVGMRLVTGNADDPNSTHQTFGNIFNSYAVSLDRLYLLYQSSFLKGAFLEVGKFPLPFYRNPVFGSLIWDSDVQPEGLFGGYRYKKAKGQKGILRAFHFILGGLYLNENSVKADPTGIAAQAMGKVQFLPKLFAYLATSYYWYSNLTPNGNDVVVGDNAGNRTVSTDLNANGIPDDFLSHFGIVHIIYALESYHLCKQIPITLAVEYMQNVRNASGAGNKGWAVGVSVGKAKKKGGWKIYYQWNVVQEDSVFSPFAQDDIPLQTNHRSHFFGVKYMLFDNFEFHTWAMVYRQIRGNKKDNLRVRFEINIRF
ncbi:MAG: hypothetical protein D6805_08550 [Planctomycetota bacterium]|nr:MAG: hypothetical protein D6805_08550 [Planctomycetota bacterium]